MPPVKFQGYRTRKNYTKEDIAAIVKEELLFLVSSAHAMLGRDLVSRILKKHSCGIRNRGSHCDRVALEYDICLRCSEIFAETGRRRIQLSDPSKVPVFPHNSSVYCLN